MFILRRSTADPVDTLRRLAGHHHLTVTVHPTCSGMHDVTLHQYRPDGRWFVAAVRKTVFLGKNPQYRVLDAPAPHLNEVRACGLSICPENLYAQLRIIHAQQPDELQPLRKLLTIKGPWG